MIKWPRNIDMFTYKFIRTILHRKQFSSIFSMSLFFPSTQFRPPLSDCTLGCTQVGSFQFILAKNVLFSPMFYVKHKGRLINPLIVCRKFLHTLRCVYFCRIDQLGERVGEGCGQAPNGIPPPPLLLVC